MESNQRRTGSNQRRTESNQRCPALASVPVGPRWWAQATVQGSTHGGDRDGDGDDGSPGAMTLGAGYGSFLFCCDSAAGYRAVYLKEPGSVLLCPMADTKSPPTVPSFLSCSNAREVHCLGPILADVVASVAAPSDKRARSVEVWPNEPRQHVVPYQSLCCLGPGPPGSPFRCNATGSLKKCRGSLGRCR